LRDFFTRRIPPFTKVLLIESGSRHLFELLIPGIYEGHGDQVEVDLVTCFPGVPNGFRGGAVYNINDYRSRALRKKLYAELNSRGYSVAGIICSGEPILAKWKWAFVARIRAKFFVLNENCDYFWLHWERWRMMLHFMLFRAGLTGGAAIPTIARLLFFPVMLVYLAAYAGLVHLRRKLRTL
jgi:hypothetical protein